MLCLLLGLHVGAVLPHELNEHSLLAAAPPAPSAQRLAQLAPPVHLSMQQAATLREACILPGGDVPPSAEAAWQHVDLPHRWAQTHPAYDGAMWYRFRVKLDEVPAVAWAVYLPRAVMNAQVWINGIPLAYTGSMVEPVTRNWYVPLLVQVPVGAWRAGDNLIQIKLVGGYITRNGLSTIEVGPLTQLESAYKQRTLIQVDAVHFANVALFALGLFMIIVWLRDRDQTAIGFQGLAAMLCGMGTTALMAPHTLTDLPVWECVAFTATVWSLQLMSLFFLRFSGNRTRLVDGGLYVMMLLTPVCIALMPSTLTKGVLFLCTFVMLMAGVAQAVMGVMRQKRRDRAWLLAGCVVLVPAAIHDVAFQLNLLPFDTVYLLPYVGPILMGCVFYMLAGDYARSRRALNRLNDNLADTVAQREEALRSSFARLAELERAQAVSAERSRILRDMHDGVGAHLTSALRQLQSPGERPLDLGLVTQTLRDSLDQLKLSIDALSLPPGDVVGLLASLRFRITPRLKAAGLELVWDVADLPVWPAGQAPALRQLQYILFEGLSNVLQHSGATQLVLSARAFDDHVRVSLSDNGKGWGGVGEGQGLQAMRARAGVIGAGIEFRHGPHGGVELRVILPMPASSVPVDLSSAA